MPRGVYDRSKTKTAAPKTEKTAAKVEKKARAPYGSKKVAAAKELPKTAQKMMAVGDAGIGTLFEGNAGYSLSELVGMRPSLVSNAFLTNQLDTLIGRKIERLLALSAPKPIVIDVPEVVEAPAATPAETPIAKAKASAPAPVQAQVAAPLQAPIPFNPTAPASSQA